MESSRVGLIVCAIVLLVLVAGCGDDKRVQQLEEENRQLRDRAAALAHDLEVARRPVPVEDDTGPALALATELAEVKARLIDMTAAVDAAESLAEQRQAVLEATDLQLKGAQAEAARLGTALEGAVHEAGAAAERYEREIASLRTQVTDLSARLDKAVKALGEEGLRRILPPP